VKKRDRERLLRIDEERLDRECHAQPGMALRIHEEWAEAKYQHAIAEAALKSALNRLKVDIRKDPAKFDLPSRPSADLVESCAMTQTRYREKLNAVIDAKFYVDQMAAAVAACADRRRTLEDLLECARMGFHSTVRPRNYEDRQTVRDREKRQTQSALDRNGNRRPARKR